MAIQNFIKTVWDANIARALQKTHVFASVANRSYQGQVKALGDKVKIVQVSDVTINQYTRGQQLSRQNMDDAALELVADQAHYFDFQVNDVDAVQEKPAVLIATTDNAGYGFRDAADTYMAGLYTQAGLTSYATSTTPWDVTSLNVEDVLLDMKEKMARLPLAGRFLICPEWFHNKLILAGLTSKADNNAIFTNGLVDKVMGFDILLSENVSATTGAPTWDQTRIIAGIRGQSFAFADAILDTEAYRPHDYFSDAVRGIYVFGAKVVRPDMTLCAYVDKTAEE